MLEFSTRKNFREKIIEFCSNNNIRITYLSNIGVDIYNVDGNFLDIDKLNNFIFKLEEQRKNKRNNMSLWDKFIENFKK